MELYPRIFFACHTRHVRDEKSRQVLTGHQASILDHLDEKEPMSLSGLAAHMGVTPGTMSIHVDRLERKGFVRRSRDAQDARVVRLRVTAAGARVRDSKSVLDADRVERLLARLKAGERKQAIAGLALLARAANEEMASYAGRRARDARDTRQAG